MNASAAVTVVGGLGLFLLGIHHLTEGLMPATRCAACFREWLAVD